MTRSILAVLAGLAVAVLTFVVAEQINHTLFPLQKLPDGNMILPIQFLFIVIFGWLLGSFLAGLIIKFISQSNSSVLPLTAGAILTLSGVANLFAVSHPLWFAVVTIIVFIPAVYLGFVLIKTKPDGYPA